MDFSIPGPIVIVMRLSAAIAIFLFLPFNWASCEPFPEEALSDKNRWEYPSFLDQFVPWETPSKVSHRRWSQPGEIFGVTPHVVTAKFIGPDISSITILFLDSGTHFGYVPRELADANERNNRDAFKKYYTGIRDKVYNGLKELSRDNPHRGAIGTQRLLRQDVIWFKAGNLVSRFHAIDEQLVKVTLFREFKESSRWLDTDAGSLSLRERSDEQKKKVKTFPNGDVLLDDIPLMPQGDRAYCGISALAMAMQFVGLSIETEDYAAAAGIRYGSTKGSRIREVYAAAAAEAGVRMTRTTAFDYQKTKWAIDAGLPVLIWRRWSEDRDYLHTMFAEKYEDDPTATLPVADEEDRETWPNRKDYAHASVVTGYNEKRREIIFTESWTENERNRRMRVEEAEGTVYYAFYLSF